MFKLEHGFMVLIFITLKVFPHIPTLGCKKKPHDFVSKEATIKAKKIRGLIKSNPIAEKKISKLRLSDLSKRVIGYDP
uniref:Uncharacterized protein n=1 Tax=Citrifermentans bremense TaxID=60035 RepID=A0A6S6M1X4_9BACT